MATKNSSSQINNVLIIALVLAAFAIGILWNKSNSAPSSTTTGGDNQQAQQDSGTPIADIAAKAGVDKNKFTACMKDGKFKSKVQSQLDTSLKGGVPGTPTTILVELKTNRSKVIFNALPFDGSGGYKEMIDGFVAGTVKQEDQDPKVTFDKIDFKKDVWYGSENAKYAVLVFEDLQCPACRAFHPTMQKVKTDYADKVVVVYRHFPLTSIHPKAFPLAEGAECVLDQKGKEAMWQYVNEVFAVGGETIKI